MQLKTKLLNFMAGRPIAVIHKSISNKGNIHVGERITLSKYNDSFVSIVDVSTDLVQPDEVAVSQEILDGLSVREGDLVEVSITNKPESTEYIKKKMDGKKLEKNEIETIVRDIVRKNEIAALTSFVRNDKKKHGADLSAPYI